MPNKLLSELIDEHDSAWPMLQEWTASSPRTVEILAADRERAEQMLLRVQVTTRSPMGAIIYHTGGLLLDHRWLRFLGSGHSQMEGSITTWNAQYIIQGALIIALDAIGGVFAINAGAFPGELKSVWYYAPDTLEWLNLNHGYSDILGWALTGDVETFYASSRWPGWEQEVTALTGDQAMSIYPPLWTEGDPIARRSRRTISLVQLVGANWEIARQLSRSGPAD